MKMGLRLLVQQIAKDHDYNIQYLSHTEGPLVTFVQPSRGGIGPSRETVMTFANLLVDELSSENNFDVEVIDEDVSHLPSHSDDVKEKIVYKIRIEKKHL